MPVFLGGIQIHVIYKNNKLIRNNDYEIVHATTGIRHQLDGKSK
jgi:hypothetical protein